MRDISNIMDTLRMIDQQHLDIRTITMGISLRDCAHPDMSRCAEKVYDKICRIAEKLVETGCAIEREFGIPIVNKRISVTPVALVTESCENGSPVAVAKAMDAAAEDVRESARLMRDMIVEINKPYQDNNTGLILEYQG